MNFTLVTAYNPPYSFSTSKHWLTTSLPTLLCGDFNLHSLNWDHTVNEEDGKAQCFCDWLASNNTKALNDWDKLTFHGHHYQHVKVINLILTNTHFFHHFDSSSVRVHTEDHYGGDHYPISIRIKLALPQDDTVDDVNLHLPQLHKGTKEDWIINTRNRLARLMANIPDSPVPDNLDSLVQNILK